MRPLQLILGPAYDETAEKMDARLRPLDILEASFVAQIVRAHWRLQACERFENPNGPEIDRLRLNAESSIRRNMAELRQLQADRHLNERLNMDVPGIARVRDILQSSILAQKLDGNPSSPDPSADDVETRLVNLLTKEQELTALDLKIRTHSEGESFSSSPEEVRAGKNSDQRPHFAGETLSLSDSAGRQSGFLSPNEAGVGENAADPTRSSGQPGRNTPCPCHSGLKYKHCCGSGAPPTLLRAA
ncbi:MAG: motif [Bryobacterales bacterium]|nr:motif [Bryobacterales bacterium]